MASAQTTSVVPRSMDHIISDINKLCSSDIYLRFADDQVKCCRTFYHLLVMDGAEVAAALLCDVNQCPVCTCPLISELDRTDFSFPYRDTESVKMPSTQRERSTSMKRVRSVLGTRMRYSISDPISYPISDIMSLCISNEIVPDIMHDIVYDFIICV